MSLSKIFVKVIGVVLALLGLALILALLNLPIFGISFTEVGGKIGELVIAIILLGVGIWIVNGGNITP